MVSLTLRVELGLRFVAALLRLSLLLISNVLKVDQGFSFSKIWTLDINNIPVNSLCFKPVLTFPKHGRSLLLYSLSARFGSYWTSSFMPGFLFLKRSLSILLPRFQLLQNDCRIFGWVCSTPAHPSSSPSGCIHK